MGEGTPKLPAGRDVHRRPDTRAARLTPFVDALTVADDRYTTVDDAFTAADDGSIRGDVGFT